MKKQKHRRTKWIFLLSYSFFLILFYWYWLLLSAERIAPWSAFMSFNTHAYIDICRLFVSSETGRGSNAAAHVPDDDDLCILYIFCVCKQKVEKWKKQTKKNPKKYEIENYIKKKCFYLICLLSPNYLCMFVCIHFINTNNRIQH